MERLRSSSRTSVGKLSVRETQWPSGYQTNVRRDQGAHAHFCKQLGVFYQIWFIYSPWSLASSLVTYIPSCVAVASISDSSGKTDKERRLDVKRLASKVGILFEKLLLNAALIRKQNIDACVYAATYARDFKIIH